MASGTSVVRGILLKRKAKHLSFRTVPTISLPLRLGLQTVAFGGVFAPQMSQMHAVYPPIWRATFVTCHHASLSTFLSVSAVKDGGEKNNKRLQATCRMADVGNYFSASFNTNCFCDAF